jgi:DMATS type aromatic prenyltransferase
MMRASAARTIGLTLADRNTEKLEQLARGLRLPPAAGGAMAGFARGLLGSLGDADPGSRAPWPCQISDDGSPVEFSVVLDPERPEVRMLWENQGGGSDFAARVKAGLDCQARLQTGYGADTSRFDRIADLFLPEDGDGAFAIWHAVTLWPSTKFPDVKAYLNPQVKGRLHAPALVEEALARLGFSRAWHSIRAAMSRGPEKDEIRYLGLDLSDDAAARVKVYIYHHDPTPDVLRRAAATAPTADPDRLVAFFEEVSGGQEGAGLSPATCLSFVATQVEPVAATLHVPVRTYVEHDGQVARRIARATGEEQARLHASAVDAIRTRPLDTGVGLTSYLSLRSPDARSRVTSYLSTETYSVTPARGSLTMNAVREEPIERLVEFYEQQPLSLHPFFQRSSRESVNVQHMWLMFTNIYGGLSQHFPRRLAHVVASIEDEAIRAMLAEQLYEELGGGDPTRTHRRLFLKLLEALAPWKPANVTPEMDRPAARLSESLEAIYFDSQPYVGVGASIVIELLGKQVDIFIANQFRRQQAVGMASLEWLTLHETLELDHADESMRMAQLIRSESDRAAARKGGQAVHAAGWGFFDDMYALCF